MGIAKIAGEATELVVPWIESTGGLILKGAGIGGALGLAGLGGKIGLEQLGEGLHNSYEYTIKGYVPQAPTQAVHQGQDYATGGQMPVIVVQEQQPTKQPATKEGFNPLGLLPIVIVAIAGYGIYKWVSKR